MPANIPGTSSVEVYSHIYNRGVEGIEIFRELEDYEVFKQYLQEYLSPPPSSKTTKTKFTVNGRTYMGSPHQPKNYHAKVALLAYSLNPTHFHLLLQETDKGAQSRFLRSLGTRYSIYFNKKYSRKGSLFDGSYKAVNLSDLNKILYLTLYMHTSATTSHSSYPVYLRQESASWINPDIVSKQVINYKDFANNMANQNDKVLEVIQDVVLEPIPETDNKEVSLERIEKVIEKKETLQVSPHTSPTKHRDFGFISMAFAGYVLLLLVGLNNVHTYTARAASPKVISELVPMPINSPEVVPMVAGSEDEVKELVYSATDMTPPDIVELEQMINPTPIEELPKVQVAMVKLDLGAYANIRELPNLESGILKKALPGEVFVVISQEHGWIKIELPDNGVGYVSLDLVQIESEETVK